MNEGDLSKLAFHLLGRGDPAGVPEPQLPIEAPPKGPDLPTGCCQHAEVPGGSHCPHHLPLNPCIQYTSYTTSQDLVVVMSMLTNDDCEQPMTVTSTTCASAGCVRVRASVIVSASVSVKCECKCECRCKSKCECRCKSVGVRV